MKHPFAWIGRKVKQGRKKVRQARKDKTLLPGLLVLALIVAAVPIWCEVYPDTSLPTQDDDSFVERVVANRLVIGTVSLAIIYLAAFTVLSVLARIWKRQWLRRGGPFEVSDDVRKLESENKRLEKDLGEARQEISKLRQRLSHAQRLVGRLYAQTRRKK